jgi:rfaE bifunctional protein nucleotidyltransferase chain/domain
MWLLSCLPVKIGHMLTVAEALQARERLRAAGLKLVFTNGHFDLLHVGHLEYLEKARALGDVLFVGVNGDASTRALKGPGRPLVPAVERARLLAALRCVDGAIIFEETTAIPLIELLRPEIYAKGGDYRDKPLPEHPTVESYGGRVILIDLVPERSTSALITRIQALTTDKTDKAE